MQWTRQSLTQLSGPLVKPEHPGSPDENKGES